MTTKKAKLGQFMTTNSDYILQGMILPSRFKGRFIEPFAGNEDLVEFMIKHRVKRNQIDCYDIDPKHQHIQHRNSLLCPIDYTNHYVITNPPYLARNKCPDKKIFDLYNLNDLYKCFIQQLVNTPPIGGIIIIPLNFWCSIRSMDITLREKFLKTFEIQRLNIFETTVFNDTTYTICAFQFEKQSTPSGSVPAYFLPSGEYLHFTLNTENQYTFGGEIYNLPVYPDISVRRLTRLNCEQDSDFITGVIVKCIDDDSLRGIQLIYTEDSNEIQKHTDHTKDLTFRSYAVLVIEPKISIDQQKHLVDRFNRFLDEKRQTTRSLFLTNYRDHYRKRISFDLVYRIVGYLLKN